MHGIHLTFIPIVEMRLKVFGLSTLRAAKNVGNTHRAFPTLIVYLASVYPESKRNIQCKLRKIMISGKFTIRPYWRHCI